MSLLLVFVFWKPVVPPPKADKCALVFRIEPWRPWPSREQWDAYTGMSDIERAECSARRERGPGGGK